MILARNPDFAVLDLDMPKVTGLEVIRRVREAGSKTRLIVLSISRDQNIIREVFAPARRVRPEGRAFAAYFDAIHYVRDGGQYLTPLLRRDPAETNKDQSRIRWASLSKRGV